MRGERWRDDAGAATVEFVALTLVLLLPLVYLVVSVARVQAGAYAAEAAAYSAARAAVVAGLDALDSGASHPTAIGDAHGAAEAAAQIVGEDFGLERIAVELQCEGGCLEPGSAVRARVAVTVGLPGVPSALRAAVPAQIVVDSVAASPVDGYVP